PVVAGQHEDEIHSRLRRHAQSARCCQSNIPVGECNIREVIATWPAPRYRPWRHNFPDRRKSAAGNNPRRRTMKVANAARRTMLGAMAVLTAAGWIAGAGAQNRAFSFAYDQPNTTAYGI